MERTHGAEGDVHSTWLLGARRLAAALALLSLGAAPALALQGGTGQQRKAGYHQPVPLRFAVIGDYGFVGNPTNDVANMIKAWGPDFIITTGDNNYPDGGQSTIDDNIGQYYQEFIHPYVGSYGPGASTNRFFPSLGNHDWDTPGAAPYLAYFRLPGNERYYDFRRGPVHFFVIDSSGKEPDGVTSTSVQAQWLQARLAASTSPFRFVYLHAAPYSSGPHGSSAILQWPFAAWGATAVFAGHEHNYQRLSVGGLPYFVCGASGFSLKPIGPPIAGSQVAFSADFGAMLVSVTRLRATVRFVTRAGIVVDTFIILPDIPGWNSPRRATEPVPGRWLDFYGFGRATTPAGIAFELSRLSKTSWLLDAVDDSDPAPIALPKDELPRPWRLHALAPGM